MENFSGVFGNFSFRIKQIESFLRQVPSNSFAVNSFGNINWTKKSANHQIVFNGGKINMTLMHL